MALAPGETNEAFIREVDENLRRSQAEEFFRRWGGWLIAGAVLVIVGTVLQVVALIRARAVPVWVWVGLLFSIITLFVPAEGALGLVTGLPMAAGAIGLGYFAVRRVSG